MWTLQMPSPRDPAGPLPLTVPNTPAGARQNGWFLAPRFRAQVLSYAGNRAQRIPQNGGNPTPRRPAMALGEGVYRDEERGGIVAGQGWGMLVGRTMFLPRRPAVWWRVAVMAPGPLGVPGRGGACPGGAVRLRHGAPHRPAGLLPQAHGPAVRPSPPPPQPAQSPRMRSPGPSHTGAWRGPPTSSSRP